MIFSVSTSLPPKYVLPEISFPPLHISTELRHYFPISTYVQRNCIDCSLPIGFFRRQNQHRRRRVRRTQHELLTAADLHNTDVDVSKLIILPPQRGNLLIHKFFFSAQKLALPHLSHCSANIILTPNQQSWALVSSPYPPWQPPLHQ